MIRMVALGFCMLLWSGFAHADIKNGIRGTYKVYVGGVSVGNLHLDFNIKQPTYQSTLLLKTGGLIGGLYNWTVKTNSKGTFLPSVRPKSYGYLSARKDHRRQININYSGITPYAKISPPWHPNKKETITNSHKKGALDPGAAAMHVANVITKTGRCNTRFKMFEGRSVLSVTVVDQGSESIRKSRHLNWSGIARKCSVTARPIAGRAARVSGWDTAKPVEVWFAQVKPNTPPIPIKAATQAKGVAARVVLTKTK